MNIDFEMVAKGAMLAIAGFFAWFAKRLHGKIDSAVTRTELKDYIDTVRLDHAKMHGENVARAEQLTRRIDDVYALLVKR
jgi:hypothetical protein